MNQKAHNDLLGEISAKLVYTDSLEKSLSSSRQQDIIKRLNEKGVYQFSIATHMNGRRGLIIDLCSSEKVLNRDDFSNLMMDKLVLMNEDRLVYDEQKNVIGIQLAKISQVMLELYAEMVFEYQLYRFFEGGEITNVKLTNEFNDYLNKRKSDINEVMSNYDNFRKFIEVIENEAGLEEMEIYDLEF